MQRILAVETLKKVGEDVLLKGWINTRRDHGKIVFFDLRDRTGVVQVVCDGEKAEGLKPEDVVAITGTIQKRPEKLVNPNLETGTVEVAVGKIELLSDAQTPPFDVISDGREIDESIRLKYRYLDLRRPRLQKNLRFRHKVIKFIRDWLDKEDFVEIETPILTKATPEGARDFIVPSRLQPGEFYALPQSPQQYKQLLMLAGFENYYQIARCFRDEDLRADRQLEFIQLDMEMSFVDQKDVLETTENLFKELVEKLTDKKIMEFPFPRITYKEAMGKYQSDRPDLRKEKDPNVLAFTFVIDFPAFEWKEQEKRWEAIHHPFTMMADKDVELLEKNPGKIKARQYDLVCNGLELGGGSIRITDPNLQKRVFRLMGHKDSDIERKFGHLLKAYRFGAPPHGGIAIGLDRVVAEFCDEESIREMIAFPVNSSGQTAVMDAPSQVDPAQLKELGIQITTPQK